MHDIDLKANMAKWYLELRETTNESFFDLYANENRYLVLCGGGGSGKSIFAGRKVLERATSEAGHRILVVRKVARTLKQSCFAQLVGQIHEHYNANHFKINQTDMSITHKNGSQILFAGLDDVEKLKSIYNITMIWVEEASEILETDLNQLDIRLRGESKYYKQIILSFNPIDITHWLKSRFFDKTKEGVTTHRSTYKDNKFLPAEDGAILESYKDTDPYYYTVYCLGEWGVYGKTVFNAQGIAERLSRLQRPISVGTFEGGFRCEENGCIKIYKDVDKRHPYVIGADTAGEGSDYFAAHVIDNITGEQVAVLHSQFDEDMFAKQIYELGKYYNNALVGIESNFSSYPAKELERLGYRNQYIREKADTFTGKVVKAYGFQTTAKTRPVAIAGLVKIARENVDYINDRETLEEMLTFIRNSKGRPEAQDGAHDDLVMSLAIAYAIRGQQSTKEIEEVRKAPVFYWDKPRENVISGGERVIV